MIIKNVFSLPFECVGRLFLICVLTPFLVSEDLAKKRNLFTIVWHLFCIGSVVDFVSVVHQILNFPMFRGRVLGLKVSMNKQDTGQQTTEAYHGSYVEVVRYSKLLKTGRFIFLKHVSVQKAAAILYLTETITKMIFS